MGSPFGINIHTLLWDGNAKAVNAVVDLGVGWIRVDFDWRSMEPQKGQYNWQVSDGLIKTAEKYQLNIYATIAYAPTWAAEYPTQSGTNSNGPKNAADWERFVKAVVSRYKGRISHWGIWNEPNLDHFLYFPSNVTRSTRVSVYLQRILIPGIRAVRQADPDAVALSPDLANLGGYVSNPITKPKEHAWNLWFEDILKGAGSQLDVITHHTYKDDYLRLLDGQTQIWEPPSVRSILQSQGVGNKPFWLTEVGWHTADVSEAQQAANYKSMLDALLARPWWHKVFPYELKDDPNIKEKWGITRADWTRKPAWTVYRDFIKAHQPVPNAGADRTVKTNTPVSFDGSASKDPDGQLVRYSWDFDHTDGVQSDATGAKVTHTFAKAGTYLVTLTVTDNHGIAIGTRITLTVQDGGPQPPQGHNVIHASTTPTIDGNLSDWPANATKIQLGKNNFVSNGTAAWGGQTDLSVQAMFVWSAKGLYFAAQVTDDKHNNTFTPSNLWQGDSIQLAIDADNDAAGPPYDKDGDYEFGFALSNNKAQWERTTAPATASNTPPQVAIRRSGTTTTYEVFLPAASLAPLKLQQNNRFGVSFLVNDHDGNSRKGWLEWTPGIGKEKNPSHYEKALLLPPTTPPAETPNNPEPPQAEPPPTDAAPSPEPATPDTPAANEAPTTPEPAGTPDSNPNTPDTNQGNPDASPTPETGSSQDNTTPGTDSGSSDNTAPTGGCGCQQNPTPSTPLLLLTLLLLLATRRRHLGSD